MYNCILRIFVHKLHCDHFLHPVEDDSSNTEANSKNGCIDPEQPSVWTQIFGIPHLNNHAGGRPICNEYFDIFDEELHRWSPFSREEEY